MKAGRQPPGEIAKLNSGIKTLHSEAHMNDSWVSAPSVND